MTDTGRTVRDIEKAAYRSRWRDGLLDLCGGLGVLFTGLAWQLERYWLTGFGVPVLMGLWFLLRRRVVEPRIGRVTFSESRRTREAGSLGAAVWLGGGLLLLFIALYVMRTRGGIRFDSRMDEWISALPVLLLGLMALAAAAMAGLPRFLGYAAVLLATGLLGLSLGLEPGPQILIAGTLISLTGLALFLRFIADHAVVSEEHVEG